MSHSQETIRICSEQFKRPELFARLGGQIESILVGPENRLHTDRMTQEFNYGMIDGICNNGRRTEELEKTLDEVVRTTQEKKPSIEIIAIYKIIVVIVIDETERIEN